MRFTRVLPLLLVVAGVRPTLAAAQWTREPVCNLGKGDYMACALYVGHVPDLRDASYASNEREVRFWTISGMFFPDQVLLIHQRGDTVTGQLLLIWSDSTISTAFARAECSGQAWVTEAGSLCGGRLAAPQDWAAVLRQLDAQGLSQLPGSPVPSYPFDPTPLPPARPGGLPRGRLNPYPTDGFSDYIEVRTSNVYWRYAFQGLPDPAAVDLKRDQAIQRLLTCAAMRFGGRPC